MVGSKDPPKGRLRRFGEVVKLSAKLGGNMVRAKLGGDAEPIAMQMAQELFGTLGQMKGLALKAGQSLSMVADQLPPEAQAVLAGLFSQAPALPFADVEAVLRRELGSRYPAAFAHIEQQPLAAASLAQVHAALLLSGEAVVIKIQYPHVAQALHDDLSNTQWLGKLSQMGGPLLDGRPYVDEVVREISRELDYTQEVTSLRAYAEALAPYPELVVPKVHADLCTERVLVLERLRGPTLQAYCDNAAQQPPEDRLQLAKLLIRALCLPFIQHNLVHGDAHPGNFIVLDGCRLGILDFGCIKQVSPAFTQGSAKMLLATLEGRIGDIAPLARQAGFTIDLPDKEAATLLKDMSEIAIGFLLGPYDFRQDTGAQRLLALKRHSPLKVARIRPPAESLLVYRSLQGLAYNIRRLQIVGDLSPLTHEILQSMPLLLSRNVP